MGLMTLAEYRDDLAIALGRELSPAKLDKWIHQSMYEFGYALKFHCLEATASFNTIEGQEAYTPTADFRVMNEHGMEVIAPANCLGRLISETRVSWRLHRSTEGSTTHSCPPEYYHVYSNQFILRPVPGADYLIEYDYWKKVPKLNAPDDVSVFSEDWDDIIFTGALYRGYRSYGEFDRYKNVRNDFLALIRSRINEEDLEEFPEGGLGIEQSPYDKVIR